MVATEVRKDLLSTSSPLGCVPHWQLLPPFLPGEGAGLCVSVALVSPVLPSPSVVGCTQAL